MKALLCVCATADKKQANHWKNGIKQGGKQFWRSNMLWNQFGKYSYSAIECYSVKLDESRCKTEERYSLGYSMKLFYITQHNKRSLLLHFPSCLSACQQYRKNWVNRKHIIQGRSVEDMGCFCSLISCSVSCCLGLILLWCGILYICLVSPGYRLGLDLTCDFISATHIPLQAAGPWVSGNSLLP